MRKKMVTENFEEKVMFLEISKKGERKLACWATEGNHALPGAACRCYRGRSHQFLWKESAAAAASPAEASPIAAAPPCLQVTLAGYSRGQS